MANNIIIHSEGELINTRLEIIERELDVLAKKFSMLLDEKKQLQGLELLRRHMGHL